MSGADEIYQSFVAALRSVGTACAMASAGIYIHRLGFVTTEGKQMLARLSQHVTIPAFFFTKIVHCDQNFSDEPCPNVTKRLRDCWILLVWPAFVVSCGLLVGEVVVRLSGVVSKGQRRSVLAACAFGNSTGLPITLLTVVHTNGMFGRGDPSLFLSVYLLLYPVLQWGLGGWLLGLDNNVGSKGDKIDDPAVSLSFTTIDAGKISSNGADAHEYTAVAGALSNGGEVSGDNMKSGVHDEELGNIRERGQSKDSTSSSLSLSTAINDCEPVELLDWQKESFPLSLQGADDHKIEPSQDVHTCFVWRYLKSNSTMISRRVQPPVIASLIGIAVSSVDSIRGVFVDLDDRDDDAPLEWVFDGLRAVGMAAVPVNMIILGINLSSAASKKSKNTSEDGRSIAENLSTLTITGIVVGKMIVQPFFGVLSTVLFGKFIGEIPGDIGASVYVVMMIVFITPTANNVMVMVELAGGSGVKESIAKAIAWQYAAAPFFLSFSVAAVIGVAKALCGTSEM